jgi:hypothetical protein
MSSRMPIAFPDPDRIGPASAKQESRPRETVTVYFSGNRPDEIAAEKLARALGAKRIREYLEIPTWRALVEKASRDGEKPGVYIRRQLQQQRGSFGSDGPNPAIQEIRARLGLNDHRPSLFTLEGKGLEDSPRQIAALIREYVPDARRVIDPFGGTANVPIVAAQMNLDAYWCEIDPLVRHIGELKIRFAMASETPRDAILDRLRHFETGAAWSLVGATRALFDFANERFKDVALDRVDWERCASHHLENLGDAPSDSQAWLKLAYARAFQRLEDENRSAEKVLLDDVARIVSSELKQMIASLRQIEPLRSIPRFIADDAAKLDELIPLEADLVVTSLFSVLTPADGLGKVMRRFVDVGDVPPSRAAAEKITSPKKVQEIVGRKLKEKAAFIHADAVNVFDSLQELTRIATALHEAGHFQEEVHVANYFVEIARNFRAVGRSLGEKATIILEVHDVWVGDVHIPVDILCANLLRLLGFDLEHDLLVDQRPDASGKPISHRVMVLRRGEVEVRSQEMGEEENGESEVGKSEPDCDSDGTSEEHDRKLEQFP